MKTLPVRVRQIGLLLAVALGGEAHAQEAAQARALPVSIEARYDPAHIQGGEKLGLLSTAMLFEVAPGWWLGPSVVGAAYGQRGGYLVMGGQVERRWALTDAWRAQLSLMAGGGSGADVPVGSGLLISPSAALMYDWGHVQTGLAWSGMNTPGGAIHSQQIGLVLSWDGHFGYFDAADVGRRANRGEGVALGFSRMMLDGATVRMRAHEGLPDATVHMLGVRAERRIGPHAYWGLEAAAAARGAADGYMEVMGSAGWETSASAIGLDGVYLGARGAIGLGGGGALRTGSGVLGKAAGVLRWDLSPDVFVGLEAGLVRSDAGRYQARYTQLQAGVLLDRPGASGPVTVQGLSWSASVQHLSHAARKDGSILPIDTIGIKLNGMLGQQFYVSGQAYSQVTGQAGAYCSGLAGLGWRAPLPESDWSLQVEALGGAAGGGGFDTQGGAVTQGMVYLGRAIGRSAQLQIGAGRVRSVRGGLSSPIVDISWNQTFGAGRN